MVDTADQPERVTGEEAKRIKRDVLGTADRKKQHGRAFTALKSRVKEPGTQQRVYRYRFCPTPSQAEQLKTTFGACRWVHNEGLALRVGAWEQHRVSVGYAESCRASTGWRQASETGWLREVSSTVLQWSLHHLDGAVTRAFKQSAKYPQRKRKHRSQDSATYVRTGFRRVENPKLPGAGHDRDVNAARNLREEGIRLYWLAASALPPGRVPPAVIKATELADVLPAA